ncbi:glycoside hydrolase family 6 protein [Mariprofundus sp. EBB-1]|uniref:glycoside hydrolase family 6 protein n=1 Tax=Mariprofundus sp. EBB-1 TaxID=2650971 RepID=UPI001F3947EE|nr:glycoside hydrolase family 6 protein [Mariprofundus sp. EBB-1]
MFMLAAMVLASTVAFAAPDAAELNAPHLTTTQADQVCFKATIHGQDLHLDASCTTMQTTNYHWLLGDGSSRKGQKLKYRYNKAGDYQITLTATGKGGKGVAVGAMRVVNDHILKVIGKKKLSPERTHVVNPYDGADTYINPDYARLIETSIKQVDKPELIARMRSMQQIATAIWLDRIPAIYGGKENNGRSSLEQHLIRALAQQREGVPMLVELVLYNLPNRDCAALSSNGTLDFRSGGLETYKKEYIDVIANVIEDPRFASLRFVLILEPDSLPNMITNLWHPECAFAHKNNVYLIGNQYAIQRMSKAVNTYLYMDIGHSGWLGWEENLKGTVAYYTKVVAGADSDSGMRAVDGFITNTSNFTPTEEQFLTDPNQQVNGEVVKSAEFYGWNPNFDEKDYIEILHAKFIESGFSKDMKFLIDTSRNGWGGDKRPKASSGSDTVNHYVDQSRLDHRFHRGNWCNPINTGLGARPITQPYGAAHPIAAFIWAKPPGESDGISDPNQAEADGEGKRFDKMCDPNYVGDFGPTPSGKPTGAMASAPASGHWFHEQFMMLIKNAYPAVEESGQIGKPVYLDIPINDTKTFRSVDLQ